MSTTSEEKIDAILGAVKDIANGMIIHARQMSDIHDKIDRVMRWQRRHDALHFHQDDPPEPAPVTPLNGSRDREDTIDEVVRTVEMVGRSQPIVLIVENDESWQETYRKQLAGKALLLQARSYPEATGLLDQILPALVILDVVLVNPDDDHSGLDVLRYLRAKEPGGRFVRVLICSAVGDPNLERAAKRLNGGGPLDFVHKPQMSVRMGEVLGHISNDPDDET